jgi:hypothetical protein
MEMLTFSSLCDAAGIRKDPIPSGQANGFNLRRQAAQPGFSPLFSAFLAYFCHLTCHCTEIKGSEP